MSIKKQIEEMACENCVHYEGCLSAFRDSKDLGLYECSEEEYFSNADECRFFYRKRSEAEWILTCTFKSPFPLPAVDLYTACSVCKWTPPKYSDDYKKYNYCPNCGSRMKGCSEGNGRLHRVHSLRKEKGGEE